VVRVPTAAINCWKYTDQATLSLPLSVAPTLGPESSQATVEQCKHSQQCNHCCLCVVGCEGLDQLQVVLSQPASWADPDLQAMQQAAHIHGKS
jgi:hypothetical protein